MLPFFLRCCEVACRPGRRLCWGGWWVCPAPCPAPPVPAAGWPAPAASPGPRSARRGPTRPARATATAARAAPWRWRGTGLGRWRSSWSPTSGSRRLAWRRVRGWRAVWPGGARHSGRSCRDMARGCVTVRPPPASSLHEGTLVRLESKHRHPGPRCCPAGYRLLRLPSTLNNPLKMYRALRILWCSAL